ncbi:MAG: ATP-dependent 6-phosphofructokinase [Verrucomicrobia bacterium]|nr:ATP-dependent 6-phosphofructokinase [Verrucomicrobiota bacterium]
MARHIGILTSGGDCPGLNAAIRAVARAACDHQIKVTGFRDGFRGLVHDQTMELQPGMLSGILTDGGTILGTSRDKPHRMPIGGKERDMTHAIVETVHRHKLDAVVCIGGGGTQKNALRLQQAGINVLTLPKTIDNDIHGTDMSFGFDTALEIATQAMDRLHSTASSHRRIMVVEIMGHRAGWLALGAGMAAGADVILIPEIAYDLGHVAEAISERAQAGKRFSIVAVAEGAMSREDAKEVSRLVKLKNSDKKAERRQASEELIAFHAQHTDHTLRLTQELEQLTGQESRLTILGHLQRGGTPTAADRLLCTRLGTACVDALLQRRFGTMMAVRGMDIIPVPIDEVAGRKKLVPSDHEWVQSAKAVGTCFGD